MFQNDRGPIAYKNRKWNHWHRQRGGNMKEGLVGIEAVSAREQIRDEEEKMSLLIWKFLN